MKRRTLVLALACILALPPLLVHGDVWEEPPRNIAALLLGIDQAQGEAHSADAIVLAVMRLDTGAVKLASIHRGVWTEGAEGGPVRLGMTTALLGPRATLEAVNTLFGLKVEHVVSVDLSGMEKIIDALGGIEINILESEQGIVMPDGKTNAFQKAGLQTLSGAQAQAYMKDHTGEEKNQGVTHVSRVLDACVRKGVAMGFDPLMELISELLDYVETNMTLMDMMEAALSAMSVPISGMEARQFPMDGREEMRDKETAVHIVDSTAEKQAMHAFLYGQPTVP